MERRKILLGSGAALATALAGCSDSETSDDDPDNDDDGNGSGETTNGNGNGNSTDDTNETGEVDVDDVPGFDGSQLDLETDAVTITEIERDGDTVDVAATSDISDYEELYAELETLADDHDEAAVDLEAFADAIDTIEWTVDHDDKQVISFTVDVSWVVDYHEGNLSKEEFLEYVKNTAE